MQKLAFSLAVVGLSATAALAQTPTTFADVDADASKELSFIELQAAWPDLAQAEFDTGDTDASGGLSVNELNTMQAAVSETPEVTEPTSAPTAPDADTPADLAP